MEDLVLPKEKDGLEELSRDFKEFFLTKEMVSFDQIGMIILDVDAFIVLKVGTVAEIVVGDVCALLISQEFEKFKLIKIARVILIFR
jgi:hypothetical protein